MDLAVWVVLAVIITVAVVWVQRKQPRTPFANLGRRTAHPPDAVQRWVALHDYAVAHGLRLLYVQQVYKHQPNGCKG